MKTIGAKIDALHKMREERRLLEEQATNIKKEADLLEAELMAQMQKEGVTKSSGTRATVSISETVQPSVEDWNVFHEYIRKTKSFHLLQRRPAALACRELFDTKGKIPGVVPVLERSLNLRSI